MMEFQPDIAIQIAFVILTLAIFLTITNLPKKALTKLRTNNRASIQSNRHFLLGAQHLTRARATKSKPHSHSLAKDSLSEAEKALTLNPKDPAAHILKALAQDLLGRKPAALRSLDVALSPPCGKSLSKSEKADALVKRAEIQLAVNKRRRVDSAVSDLVEAVELVGNDGHVTAFGLLGQCYEIKGMRDEAVEAFRMAVKVDPQNVLAREGLGRLKD